MNKTFDTPRNRVYKATLQDGSIDLFAGLALIGVGVFWLIDLVAIGAVVPGFAVPIWAAFRTRVVEPRIGHVRFDQGRRMQLRLGQLVVLAIGSAFLVCGLIGYFIIRSDHSLVQILQSVSPAIPAVLVGIAAGLSAILFSIPRFLLYALACLFTGAAVTVFDADPGWSLIGSGLFAAIFGTLLLIRFLQEFPRLSSTLE